MKYLLTILVISALSCNKSTDSAKQETAATPKATNCKCQTNYSIPSVPTAFWSATLNVPDTNAVTKLTFRVAGTLSIVFEIEKPKSKTYSQLRQPGRPCPTGYNQAYYFFEWLMADGTKIKEEPFQVAE